jgi:hypothetical protein
MSMLPMSDMSPITGSQEHAEVRFIPSDPHQIDETGDPGPFTMELADVYSAILVVVPLGILAKSLIL